MKKENRLNFIQSWNNRGNNFYNLGRYQEAIECYDKALEIDPNIAGIWYNKALCFYNLQRYQEGIDCHHRVVEIDPTYGDYHKEWCAICRKIILINIDASLRTGDRYYHTECHSQFLKRLDQCRDFENSGEYSKAIQCYDNLLELYPNEFFVWGYKGLALYHLSRYKEALKHYDKALEIEPNSAELWYNTALCLDRMGKGKEAKDRYNKALEIDPEMGQND